MPTLDQMLDPRCPQHPHVSLNKGACWFCTHKNETPQECDARMAAFHRRFPALGAAALRVPEPGYRTEAEAYDEGIFDDD